MIDALRAALGPDAVAIIGCMFGLFVALVVMAWIADHRER